MEQNFKRPLELPNTTYKIKPSIIDEAVYITICEHEGVPVEVFINSKNMQNYQWISALTRLLSSVLRHGLERGAFPEYAIKDLVETHDPTGGYYRSDGDKCWVPSIVAHIGLVIREHCEAKGIIERSA